MAHEGGEDFIFRLVNLNFKELKSEYYDELMKIKADPAFDNVCLNAVYAYDIIDLADWIEYICIGYQFQKDLVGAKAEYEKIRKDIDKRQNNGLQMSEKFWQEALD